MSNVVKANTPSDSVCDWRAFFFCEACAEWMDEYIAYKLIMIEHVNRN